MPQTEAQKRASRAAHAKKLEHGFKRQWFFMAPEAAAHLAKAKAAEEGVTAEALLNRAILLLPVKAAPPAPAENPAPPASVTRGGKRAAAKPRNDPKTPPEDEPLRFPRAPYGSLTKPVKGTKR
jgi:hypothetical protein